MSKKAISVKEFKEIYNISLAKAYELVNRNGFPMIKIGKKYLILVDKLDCYMESLVGECL